MSKIGWSKEKPTEDGFYFYREVWPGDQPKMWSITVLDGVIRFCNGRQMYRHSAWYGHFYGPVEPPEFEEEA